MSDVILVALITGGFTLSGMALTQLFHFLLQGREIEERYRVGLYERRVAIYQEGALHVDKLQASDSATLPDSLAEARNWLISHCLYLDPYASSAILDLFDVCLDRIRGETTGPSIDDQAAKTIGALAKGLGGKHIDPQLINSEFQRLAGQRHDP